MVCEEGNVFITDDGKDDLEHVEKLVWFCSRHASMVLVLQGQCPESRLWSD